jgi:hypothetical protein
MTQVDELNDRLGALAAGATLTAADLDLEGAAVLSHGRAGDKTLSAHAVLESVCYDGPPEFPYIHAHFRPAPTESGSVTVDLHTRALRTLGHLLHVREVWGVGSEQSTDHTAGC